MDEKELWDAFLEDEIQYKQAYDNVEETEYGKAGSMTNLIKKTTCKHTPPFPYVVYASIFFWPECIHFFHFKHFLF